MRFDQLANEFTVVQRERDRLAALNADLINILETFAYFTPNSVDEHGRFAIGTGQWDLYVRDLTKAQALLANVSPENDDRSEAQVAAMIEDEEQPKGRVP